MDSLAISPVTDSNSVPTFKQSHESFLKRNQRQEDFSVGSALVLPVQSFSSVVGPALRDPSIDGFA